VPRFQPKGTGKADSPEGRRGKAKPFRTQHVR